LQIKILLDVFPTLWRANNMPLDVATRQTIGKALDVFREDFAYLEQNALQGLGIDISDNDKRLFSIALKEGEETAEFLAAKANIAALSFEDNVGVLRWLQYRRALAE
jgi:hypothetical protein